MLDIRKNDSTEKKIRMAVTRIDKPLNLKNTTNNIGVINVLIRNEKILQYLAEYLDKNSTEYDFIDIESYILNILNDVIEKKVFSAEKKIIFIEKLIDVTSKKSKLLSVTLMGMCSIHFIKEEYYDLSDVLRRVAFHLSEENSKQMRTGLESILEKFMPVVKREDPQGFCIVIDILSEIYPIEEKQYDLEDII